MLPFSYRRIVLTSQKLCTAAVSCDRCAVCLLSLKMLPRSAILFASFLWYSSYEVILHRTLSSPRPAPPPTVWQSELLGFLLPSPHGKWNECLRLLLQKAVLALAQVPFFFLSSNPASLLVLHLLCGILLIGVCARWAFSLCAFYKLIIILNSVFVNTFFSIFWRNYVFCR